MQQKWIAYNSHNQPFEVLLGTAKDVYYYNNNQWILLGYIGNNGTIIAKSANGSYLNTGCRVATQMEVNNLTQQNNQVVQPMTQQPVLNNVPLNTVGINAVPGATMMNNGAEIKTETPTRRSKRRGPVESNVSQPVQEVKQVTETNVVEKVNYLTNMTITDMVAIPSCYTHIASVMFDRSYDSVSATINDVLNVNSEDNKPINIVKDIKIEKIGDREKVLGSDWSYTYLSSKEIEVNSSDENTIVVKDLIWVIQHYYAIDKLLATEIHNTHNYIKDSLDLNKTEIKGDFSISDTTVEMFNRWLKNALYISNDRLRMSSNLLKDISELRPNYNKIKKMEVKGSNELAIIISIVIARLLSIIDDIEIAPDVIKFMAERHVLKVSPHPKLLAELEDLQYKQGMLIILEATTPLIYKLVKMLKFDKTNQAFIVVDDKIYVAEHRGDKVYMNNVNPGDLNFITVETNLNSIRPIR